MCVGCPFYDWSTQFRKYGCRFENPIRPDPTREWDYKKTGWRDSREPRCDRIDTTFADVDAVDVVDGAAQHTMLCIRSQLSLTGTLRLFVNQLASETTGSRVSQSETSDDIYTRLLLDSYSPSSLTRKENFYKGTLLRANYRFSLIRIRTLSFYVFQLRF